VPKDTTVSAVVLPVERAMLGTLSTGIWLADDDL